MLHQLRQEQFLPISIETAWEFFATPANLNLITPQDLVFEITSTMPEKMYPGLLITYNIQPLPGVKMHWVTEITHLREFLYFVDEQRKGPFRIWHHEHHFRPVEEGVVMTDIVSYDIGKSILGWLAGKLFVHKQIHRIFEHRFGVLAEHFSRPKSTNFI
jgi:ligand-binding SRPBCC domain-containing protein